MDLFAEVVDGDVGGCAHEDLALGLLDEVVHERGRGHRLAGAGWALDEAERARERLRDGVDLRVVQIGQAGDIEPAARKKTPRTGLG